MLKTIMSSKYIRQSWDVNPASTHSMSLWNVGGALVSPKGITKCPLGVEKAVFALASAVSSTCQYPDARSRKGCEVDRSNHGVKCSINPGQRVGILLCHCINLSIINAEPP